MYVCCMHACMYVCLFVCLFVVCLYVHGMWALKELLYEDSGLLCVD